jgi:hypothetical protein
LSADFTIVDWAAVLSGFATTGLVGFVAYQIHQTRQQLTMTKQEVEMTKKQMDASLRAWIGADELGLQVDPTGKVIFNFRNYGSLPALNIKSKYAFSNLKFERQRLREGEVTDLKNAVLFPDEAKHHGVYVPGQLYQELSGAGLPLFVGVVLKYQFAANEFGEYGAIIEYDTKTMKPNFLDEWTDRQG